MKLTLIGFLIGLVPCQLALLANEGRGQEGKPNIILIFCDDLGFEDLGVQGSAEVKTPHIDSLATNGVRFSSAYVTAPVCSPSRAGLLTGRYQNRFGFEFLVSDTAMVAPGKKVGLATGEVTLADRMKDLGYVTGCIGKWHLGKEEEFLPSNRGFDEFYGTLGQSGYYEPLIYDSRNGMKKIKIETPGYYTTDDYSERAVDFVNRHHHHPFFLYLAHFAVHKPHDATEEYLSRFPGIEDPIRRAYCAMLSAMDDGIGDLMSALRENEIEENTLVVFLSDNGGTQGSSNVPLRGKKGGTWEGGIRVPLLIQWKDQFRGGRIFEDPVISLDLLPTLVAAARGKPDPAWNLDGVDLLPFLRGKEEEPAERNLFWRFGTQWAVRSGNWKLVQGREARGGSIQVARIGPPRLFDLSRDVGEVHDLAEEMPEKVEELTRLWRDWNAPIPEPWWTPAESP